MYQHLDKITVGKLYWFDYYDTDSWDRIIEGSQNPLRSIVLVLSVNKYTAKGIPIAGHWAKMYKRNPNIINSFATSRFHLEADKAECGNKLIKILFDT